MSQPAESSQAAPGAPSGGSTEDTGRRKRPVLWVSVAVGVAVLGLLGVLATRPDASTRAVDSPLLGEPVPGIEAVTLDGSRFSFEQTRGEWVLVNFFATWCVPCRQEHDDLIRFHERHAELGDGRVVGVIYSDSTGAVERFVAENGGGWEMLTDPDGRVSLEFGVSGVPESFLVTPDGIVAAKLVGGVEWSRLEALLADLQAQLGRAGAIDPAAGS